MLVCHAERTLPESLRLRSGQAPDLREAIVFATPIDRKSLRVGPSTACVAKLRTPLRMTDWETGDEALRLCYSDYRQSSILRRGLGRGLTRRRMDHSDHARKRFIMLEGGARTSAMRVTSPSPSPWTSLDKERDQNYSRLGK